MLFYKVQGKLPTAQYEEFPMEDFGKGAKEICSKSEAFNAQHEKNSYFFLVSSSSSMVSAGVITENTEKLSSRVIDFFHTLDFYPEQITFTEITLGSLKSLLKSAFYADYIVGEDAVLEKIGLDKIAGRYELEFGEELIDDFQKEKLIAEAQEFLMNDSLIPELDRICAGKARAGVSGHPVHYILQVDDTYVKQDVCRLLLQALYANDRLESRRYTCLGLQSCENHSFSFYDALFKACKGGAIVINCAANGNAREVENASDAIATVTNFCEVAKRYRNEVLTIFCFPSRCEKLKRDFLHCLGSFSFIDLKEDSVKGDRTIECLKFLARKNHIRTDKKLFSKIDMARTYPVNELKILFDSWYSDKLKSTVYPQYKEFSAASCRSIEDQTKGIAYEKLNELIGLTEAKSVIKKAVNYYKMQALYRQKGIQEDRPSMHMIFSGNPGTAKTTVARLFAQIMRDNGLLSQGQLIEVGRGDLIEKYVGWTAQNVKAKFAAAAGGVLFIDEAYSLVDDRDGSYGDEAINTIVQEMENHREDVVVIFAGYPNKMEHFLQKNPGLRSRIAFHVPFDDYSTDELCEIARLMGRGKGINFDNAAMDKLSVLFQQAKAQEDFGNGRYVRNVLEQARMNQASRLMERDLGTISDEDISTITAADIELPMTTVNGTKHKIGFC